MSDQHSSGQVTGLDRPTQLDRERLRAFLEKRRVSQVFHFTPLENLPSICTSGKLYNREKIDYLRSLLGDLDSYRVTDAGRSDNARWAICCSIEWPNFHMLSQKRRFLSQHFAILALDASLLWELKCVFLPTNAASSSVASSIPTLRQQAAGRATQLQTLYPDPDSRPLALRKYPGNIQAEVLVDEPFIAISEYGLGIVFRHQEDYEEYAYLRRLTHMKLSTEPKYFGQRPDGAR